MLSIAGQVINPVLLILGSAGAYMFIDMTLNRRRRRKLPASGIYHAYEIGLTEDDFDLPENIKVTVKKGQYFPAPYTFLATKMPLFAAMTAGMVFGDYIMDKIRKRQAKKEYDKLQRQFDETLNEAFLIAKIKSDIKSASLEKKAFIFETLFTITDAIMTTLVKAFAPDLTHRDIVHIYTYSITPYVFWSSYRSAAGSLDTADKTKAAIINFMNNRSAAIPAAAVIPALQEATRLQAVMKKKERKPAVQQTLEHKQKMLEQLFSKDIAKAPELGTEYKNRQTLQEIFDTVKSEQQQQ